MMRSLYSGVAGLKTHQTRMDVIGNNIANVNTTAYKSSSMTFSELMSQTTQKASGANATTGVGGTNAKQIGLGVARVCDNLESNHRDFFFGCHIAFLSHMNHGEHRVRAYALRCVWQEH